MLGSKYFAIKLFGRTILLQPNNGVGGEEEKSLGINGTPPEHKHQDQELAVSSFKSCSDEEQKSLDSTGNSKEKTATKKKKQQQQQPPETTVVLPCPRCRSLNTKFCYYNNRKVSQPRHFCKNCQRYWTAGGFTRNVPLGSGRRKKKKNTSSKVFAVQNGCNLSTGTSVMPFYYAAVYCDSAPSFGKIDALRGRGGGEGGAYFNSFVPIQ